MHGKTIKNNKNTPKEQPEKWQNRETTITGASLEWLSARHCETRSTFFSTRIVQVSLWEQWYLICSYCWYSLVIKINLPIRWSGVYGAGRSPSWVSHQWHWQDLHRHTQVSANSIISIYLNDQHYVAPRSIRSRDWVFGQFEEPVLFASLFLLDRARMPLDARADPVQVFVMETSRLNSIWKLIRKQHGFMHGHWPMTIGPLLQVARAVSAMVNHLDDWGVLEGSW